MEDNIFRIDDKKCKTFESFYESDGFSTIDNEETKRKLFYYYALKFSSERNKDIKHYIRI